MHRVYKATEFNRRLVTVMLDPLSYINPSRCRLPQIFNTPRHRAVVNKMLIADLPLELHHLKFARFSQMRWLLRHWEILPDVCMLVGAQLLKSGFARNGQLLRMPRFVRDFMSLPLQEIVADAGLQAEETTSRYLNVVRGDEVNPMLQAQCVGLLHLLDWLDQVPDVLLSRLRFLFPAELDVCFDFSGNHLGKNERFLILQATHYAKNNSDNA